ncbi:hypothetical protein VSR01_29615 [Actinacidiphila sp. DG2A-62]|nr:hypothetical protein [Actinacidiphila sp. DG2A-62]MEC3997436.1 hypothetical protein [Actinacidiphila sp. DG2A-62]
MLRSKKPQESRSSSTTVANSSGSRRSPCSILARNDISMCSFAASSTRLSPARSR